MENGFVDDELDLERRREGGDLQRGRQRDHLASALPARHLRPQAGQVDRRLGLDRPEAGRGRSSSTTPVKCFDSSASGSFLHADGGSWITAALALIDLSTTK